MSAVFMLLHKKREEELAEEKEEEQKNPYKECWYCDGAGLESYVIKYRKFWFNKTDFRKCHICNGEGKILKESGNDFG